MSSTNINSSDLEAQSIKSDVSKPFVEFLNNSGGVLHTIRKYQAAYKDYLAEFFSTLVFALIGIGVNAQFTSSTNRDDKLAFFARFTWGLALALAVYMGRSVSVGINKDTSII
jgi:NhaP-type Na+/H+ or K+/H+ antiporter